MVGVRPDDERLPYAVGGVLMAVAAFFSGRRARALWGVRRALGPTRTGRTPRERKGRRSAR